MKMNRRGIVVEFLTTMLLALLIFVPACLFVSGLFRLSDQANDSYKELAKQMQDLTGEPKSMVFILDEETAVIAYAQKERGKQFTKLFDDSYDAPYTLTRSVQYYLPYPEVNCQGQVSCLCLCRSFSEEEGITFETNRESGIGWIHDNLKAETQCQNLQCQGLPVKLKESWSLYREKGGVRRTNLNLVKEGDVIQIIKKS